MTKKYPIGTKIRFIHKTFDNNKEGVIVGIHINGNPDVYLPMAEKHVRDNRHPTLPNGVKFTWHCHWYEIEPLITKGQQLLFAFME